MVRFVVGMKKCLLIGFGNTLRRDDGLGPYIVDSIAVESYCGMEVRKISIPQIDLILADDLSKVDLALFVDSRIDDSDDLVKVEHCAPSREPSLCSHTSHSLSIQDLINLTRDLYGRVPESYIVMPKGFDFSLGEDLTSKAKKSAVLAVQTVTDLVYQLG